MGRAKKQSEAVVIEIPKLKVKKAKITIVGDSPLIVKKFSQKAKEEIALKQEKKAKAEVKAIEAFEQFAESLHWITQEPKVLTEETFNEAVKKGAKFGFPATGIKQAACSGAFRNKLTKDKVSLYGTFHILEELCEIKGKLRMREDYARNPMTGGAVMTYRPEFTDWTITFTLEYNENAYSLEQIVNFINIGGFSCGIGMWRPEKGGDKGRFHVK